MKLVEIKGTIVADAEAWLYDYFGVECTCPKKVKEALIEAKGEEVTLAVNSGGGDLWAGNEIAYMISTYAGKTIADITGLAASAATVICCGADKVRMAPGAQYMIHNVSAGAAGNHQAMDKMSEILQNADKATSNVYRAKTGMDNKSLLELMEEETWMDVDKAMSYGFVDEIIENDSARGKTAAFSLNNAAPTCIILTEEQKAEARAAKEMGSLESQRMRNQLNYLKLGGVNRV